MADFGSPVLALVFIAEQKGFFADEDLEIDHLHFDLGRDALDAMLLRRADVSMAYLTPVALRSFETSEIRILTSLHHAHGNTAVVARIDRGIRSASDLRGKRVGVPRDTSAELFLQTLLTLSAVPPRDVEFVDVPPEELPDAASSSTTSTRAIDRLRRDLQSARHLSREIDRRRGKTHRTGAGRVRRLSGRSATVRPRRRARKGPRHERLR